MSSLRRSRHARAGNQRMRGQSVAEFALVGAVLLALVGVAVDFARLYQAWLNIESGTRDAAQYLATSNPDPLDVNYSGTNPNEKAQYLLQLATGVTFSINATQATCPDGRVTTTYTQSTAVTEGGSVAYPVGIGKVTSCMPFKTLFAYPILGADGDLLLLSGNWVLRSERTYRTLVGR
jgi:Flp pilus assembly protein TadG